MKAYKWKSHYGPVYIDCYNTTDLVDVTNRLFSWNRAFKSYTEAFGTFLTKLRKISSYKYKSKEIIGTKLALQIIRIFIELVIEDLIYNNDTYRFPNKLGDLTIGIEDPESPKYVYNIYTGGNNYMPVLLMPKEKQKKVKHKYYVDFTTKYKNMLNCEVNKGHQYASQFENNTTLIQ